MSVGVPLRDGAVHVLDDVLDLSCACHVTSRVDGLILGVVGALRALVTFDPETVKKQKAEKLPAFVQWPADNFNNLLEQPTQFYSIVLGLTVLGGP